MKWPKFLFFILLINVSIFAIAQDYQSVVRSNITQEIKGVEYYLHEVKKGETLSAISRAYHVNLKDITENNYGIDDQIKPGDIIKIPLNPVKEKEDDAVEQAMNYRRISSGETLYSLSKEFNVTVDEIKAANGGLPNGLKTGDFIKIPVRDRSGSGNVNPQDNAGKNWFEYQVKDKENPYQLAIKYRISVDSVFLLNPGLSEKLQKGQIIKIPISKRPKTFIRHTVQQQQSMNRLARKYDLDLEQIRTINPYISRHLQIGQVIRIPLPVIENDNNNQELITDKDREMAETTHEKSQQEICHNKYDMQSYKVALIVPFFISVYDSIKNIAPEESENKNPEFIKSFVFIQFYEGFLMAVDSMRKAGLQVDLHVYNLEDDVKQAKVLIKNPDFKNMDLIVGPVYSNTFKIVADFAQEHSINIVNPLSTRIETSYGNPYVFQPQQVNYDQNELLVDYLNEYHDFSQIFIARHNAYRDELAMNDLKSALNKDLDTRQIPSTSLYHEIIFSQDSTYTFEHLASVDYQNVVVVYSESKVFILDILRSLNELRDTFNIMVIGMPEWNKIEGIEAEHLNNLNAHIFAREYTNYKLENVRSFVQRFREQYATEPNNFAFTGYNIGVYFLGALMKYGPSFRDCIPYFDMELLNMGIQFESSGNNGFRNKNWKILEMKDYKFRDATKRMTTYDLSKPPEQYYRFMEGN